jgi:hypothetical protein
LKKVKTQKNTVNGGRNRTDAKDAAKQAIPDKGGKPSHIKPSQATEDREADMERPKKKMKVHA